MPPLNRDMRSIVKSSRHATNEYPPPPSFPYPLPLRLFSLNPLGCRQGTRQSARTRRRQQRHSKPPNACVRLGTVVPHHGTRPTHPLPVSTPVPQEPATSEALRGRKMSFTPRWPGGSFLRAGRGLQICRSWSRPGDRLR